MHRINDNKGVNNIQEKYWTNLYEFFVEMDRKVMATAIASNEKVWRRQKEWNFTCNGCCGASELFSHTKKLYY